jgi:hypothetical protein
MGQVGFAMSLRRKSRLPAALFDPRSETCLPS